MNERSRGGRGADRDARGGTAVGIRTARVLPIVAGLLLCFLGALGAQEPPAWEAWLGEVRAHDSAGRYAQALALLRTPPEIPITELSSVLEEHAIALLGSLDLAGAAAVLFDSMGKDAIDSNAAARGILAAAAGDPERAAVEFLDGAFPGALSQRPILLAHLASGDPAVLTHAPRRDTWSDAVIRWLLGELSDEQIAARATEPDQRAELAFIRAVQSRRAGQTADALAALDECLAGGDGRSPHTLWARVLRAQLRDELPAFSLPQRMVQHWGVIDRGGEFTIPPRFRSCSVPGEPIAARHARSGSEGWVDATGRWLIAPAFDDLGPLSKDGLAVARLRAGGPAGYLSRQGEWAIAPQFIALEGPDAGGALASIAVEGRERFGFLAPDGNWRIPPRFAPGSRAFSEGFACVREEWKGPYSFIDRSGEVRFPARTWCPTQFSEGLAAIQPEEDGLFGYIDTSGALVIEPQFSEAGAFVEGRAVVRSAELPPPANARLIDRSGKPVGEIRFVDAGAFSEGLIAVTFEAPATMSRRGDGIFLAPEDPNFARMRGESVRFQPMSVHLDREGVPITARRFHQVRGFSEGLAAAREGGLWGYIGRDGEWVIPPRFAEAREFLGGRAPAALRVEEARVPWFDPAEFASLPFATEAAEVVEGEALLDFSNHLRDGFERLLLRVPRVPDPVAEEREVLALLRAVRERLASDRAGEVFDEWLCSRGRAEFLEGDDRDLSRNRITPPRWLPTRAWSSWGVPTVAAQAIAASGESVRARAEALAREAVSHIDVDPTIWSQLVAGPILIEALLEHSAELRALARERYVDVGEGRRREEVALLDALIDAIERGDPEVRRSSAFGTIHYGWTHEGRAALQRTPQGVRLVALHP